jgi:peptidoglycan/xylan/chitin deacetylase (PgdA/CDA1 family)
MSIYGRNNLLLRLAYLGVSLACWALTGLGRLRRPGTVVLCYHAVTAAQRGRFEQQMRMLEGRTAGTGAPSAPGGGGRRRPRVWVTFDDAFACLLEHALPVMNALDVPATVFVVTGNMGGTPGWEMRGGAAHPDAGLRTMSAEQITRAAGAAVCRFGSHTESHARLTGLDTQRLVDELGNSKAALERLLGKTIRDLALPYGAYDERALEEAAAMGYQRIYTLDPRVEPADRRLGVLGRFRMSPDVWPLEFRLTIDGAYSWQGAARRAARSLKRLVGLSGGAKAPERAASCATS